MRTMPLLVRLAACAMLWWALPGCNATVTPSASAGQLAGSIWDVATRREISATALLQRAPAARLVVLGETHDNTEHHRHQSEILAAMLRAGRSPALVVEQFDTEHQAALDAARARGERDPERIADAGRFDRKGWRWQDYRPLVELALANALPILAANVSREQARAIIRAGAPAEGLGASSPALRAALERDLIEGHCGARPPDAVLAGMTEAQRARDARMAKALESAGERGAVLIAGAGHARRDRGAPLYLAPDLRAKTLVVAFVEIEAGKNRPEDYGDIAGSYDVVWFTPRAHRQDPCADPKNPPPR
jgi:uncharacterized iron-regulated protein